MSKRKTKQTASGELPALTRLKRLPADERMKLMAVLDENTYDKAAPLLENLVGFACSRDVLSKFYQWQSTQQELEGTNDWLAQFEEFTRKQNPDWSPEKVREQAIAFFMVQTAGRKDRKGFVQIAQLDLEERKARTKAVHDDRKIAISERRVALLEKKAAQADQAKGVLGNKALSQEEKQARMKEIFGMS